jgi:phosphate uptake regulator
MAKANETKKKTVKIEIDKEEIKREFDKLGREIKSMLKTAKDRYDQADPKAKKAVVAGVAAAATIIAGVIGYKKMKKK